MHPVQERLDWIQAERERRQDTPKGKDKDLAERKFLRDSLAMAIANETDSPSIYTLYWAMKNIDEADKKATFDYCVLAITIQILIPILITLANIPHGASIRGIVCPMRHEEATINSVALHLAGYLVCVFTLLTTWGDVRNESLVFEFLAQCEFIPFNKKDPDNTGKLHFPSIKYVDVALQTTESEKRRRQGSFTAVHANKFQNELMSIVADIQELSCA